MEIQKGFKKTEIGVIPEDWEVKKIDDFSIKVGSGITPTGGERVYKKEGRPFLRSQNVGWGTLILDEIAFIDENTHSTFNSTEIQENDVFLNITGASIGRSAIADNRVLKGNVNQHVCIIRVDTKKIEPRFLNCFLLSFLGQQQISNFQAGGNRQGLNFGQIKSIQIPFPPTLAEQTAIANVLNDADKLITALEKLIAKKRNIKQGAMQELLKPKEGWEVKKLGRVADYKNGKSYENRTVENSNFNLITLNSIDINGKLKTEHLKVDINDNSLDKNDLIIILSDVAHGNFLGLTDIIPESNKYVLNQRVGALKNIREVLPYFLRMFINTNQRYFKMNGQGSSQQNLGKESIINFDIFFPKIDEQKAICQILSDMDAEIDALEKKLEKYKMIKQGMMQELLTGKTRLI